MGRIRLQVIITLVAIMVLMAAMGYLAFSVTTVVVPDYGGTHVEGLAGNPQAINPILCHLNPVDRDIAMLVFTGLTRVSSKGEIVPDLAEQWDISPDGTVYTFRLRQDVLWHDGAPFSAEDVAYTINAIQHPDFQGAPSLAEMWRTVQVEQVDRHTVRFALREPFAPFLDYTTVGILPAHILSGVPVGTLSESKFNTEPVGTGPFRVAEVSAQSVTLAVNPSYYRTRPYLDSIEFVFYPNEPSLYEARRRGEIGAVARVLPEHLKAVRDDEGLTLYSAPISGYTLVFINLDRGIFQDPLVRQAMMHALDRQKLVDEVLEGQGIVIHSPILPTSWAYDSHVKQYEYDPQRARVLLEEAGWFDDNGDGVREKGALRLEFSLLTNEDDPTRVRLIQAISDQLAEVGIHAVPETTNWEELVSERLRLRRFDAILGGWQGLPPDPDPYPYWHSSQVSEDGLNFSNYISEQADFLLEEARFTSDRETRVEYYRRFQETYARDVPALLLYQPVYNYAVDTGVRNVQIPPLVDASERFGAISNWYVATQRLLYSEARERGLTERPR